MWFVYMLKSCERNWYYIGSTDNIGRRIEERNLGKTRSTRSYRPFELVFIREFLSEYEARNYERRLKDKRIEKEKLIKQYKKNS